MSPTVRPHVQLLVGCVVLGVGVSLLLAPGLGSDGFSTLVSGLSTSSGLSFLVANAVVSLGFVLLAWMRGVRPGPGTLVQIVVVGSVVTILLPHLTPPDDRVLLRALMLVAAVPVAALGVALYLASHRGAGPVEAAALAYDPPLPFAWTYSAVQGGGALVGWQLGAAIGPGTVAVIVALGPSVALVGRALRLDLHQPGQG